MSFTLTTDNSYTYFNGCHSPNEVEEFPHIIYNPAIHKIGVMRVDIPGLESLDGQ